MGSLINSGLLSSVAQAVPTPQPGMPLGLPTGMQAMPGLNTLGFDPFPRYGFSSFSDYDTARSSGTPMNQNISDLEDYLGTLRSAQMMNVPGLNKDLTTEDISRLQDEYVKKMASTSNALNPTVTASTPTTKPDYRQQALSEMLSRYNVGSLSDIKNFNYLLPGYKDSNNLNVRTFETRDPLLAVDRRAQQLENAAARTSVNMQGYRPGAMDGGIMGTRIGYKNGDMISPTDSNEEGIGGVIYQDEDGNIISKKEAMKLFKKQAEEEEKEKKNKKAYGGIINLMSGGMPSMEMDYRGGGFIPVGAKERADDVPARLSKNEFVMTADAVRAAGGGSVDEGARRMYQLMDALEGRRT
jgi:hypothetical protein